MPILVAPITGSTYNMGGKMTEEEFITEMVSGALMRDSLCMTGDGADPTMLRGDQGGSRQQGRVNCDQSNPGPGGDCRSPEDRRGGGSAGVGMDIDGAGLVTMAMKDSRRSQDADRTAGGDWRHQAALHRQGHHDR
jgi:hypothetical protein